MRITYKKQFEKNFKKLPLKIKEQFYERLEVFISNKFDVGLNNHSVDKVFPGCKSINITGDYRAIFAEENNSVVFITIGTHSELY
jgi:mRNA-degrading endonuclease YafQ of YafQ-DinJ toxin-antitoxin module